MKKRLKFFTAFLLISLLVMGNGLPTGVYSLTDSGADIEIESTVEAPDFDTPVSYDVDASAASVAKGDLNSDGVLDLILTHENGSAFSCLMGNEDGTFASPQVTSTINYPTSPCPGDFNEDGDLDLAFVSGQTHGLHIHLGNGDGTFQSQNVYAVGTSPGRVIDADVNQDGMLDLIVANYHSDNISVLTGNGDGTFNSHVDFSTGDGPSDIEAKDFDGDGQVDIAVLNNYDESFSILINNSADNMVSFSTGETYTLDGSEPWSGAKDLGSLLASDIVGNDGIDDLAMTVCLKGEFDSYLLIYEGIGDGTFQLVYSVSTGKQAYDIVLGDFNNDAQPDLAMTNRYYSKVVILCKADDTWQYFDNYPAGSTPNQIVTGDFNGDGLDDLAAANPNSEAGLTILLQYYGGGGDDTCIIDGCDTPISEGGFANWLTFEGDDDTVYYCVENRANLEHINQHMESKFVQLEDIDLGDAPWTPIGGFHDWNTFYGEYIAINDSSIKNMSFNYEDSNEMYAGLFSLLSEGAHIEGINLIIDEVDLQRTGIDEGEIEQVIYTGDLYFGGIAALHESPKTIVDCTVTFGSIRVENEQGDIYFGGITGKNLGDIYGCRTATNPDGKISISTDETSYVGGITGCNEGYLFNCDHAGKMYVEPMDQTYAQSIYLGGIAGFMNSDSYTDYAIAENCQNDGDIIIANVVNEETPEFKDSHIFNSYAGGIVGYLYAESEVNTRVSNDPPNDRGYAGAVIINCANIGTDKIVSSEATSAMAGGIAGASRFVPDVCPYIINCYNRSAVSSTMIEAPRTVGVSVQKVAGANCEGAASGGIIGASGGIIIEYSYSAAPTVTAAAVSTPVFRIAPSEVEGLAYSGGLAGLVWDSQFDNNYYEKNESIQNGIGGEVVALNQDPLSGDMVVSEFPGYGIQPVTDMENFLGVTSEQLKDKTFIGDAWGWYPGGGEPPQYYFYDEENNSVLKQWRYTAANTYPVLRGAVPVVTPDNPPSDHDRGSSKPAAVTTPAALNKVDHFAYVVGYPNGEVKPLGTITREEVAVIFYRLMTEESRKVYFTTSQSFTDVSSNRWSNKEIATLYNAKIILGNSDGTFMPAKPITRAEFSVIAAKFDKLEKTQENKFSDISNHWAKDYINSSAEKGWISGYEDGTFRPDNSITRCEAMKLINEVLDRRVDLAGLHKDARQYPDNTQGKWYYEIVLEATNTHDYERENKPKSIEKWTKIKGDPVW